MAKKVEACLVCGEELVYFNESKEMECVYCRKRFKSNASCLNGHFVCDGCHAAQAVERIKRVCLETQSKDPIGIAVEMMEDPFVHMHGPENHVLVGAALLAAYCNSGGDINLSGALSELARRGGQVPGGVCGFWGCCGAAVSAGIFISVVTGSTPLAGEEFGLCNEMTSRALAAIAHIGGPRCCKRSAFAAIEQAAVFCREKLGVNMAVSESITCGFAAKNQQCIGIKCPFFKKAK